MAYVLEPAAPVSRELRRVVVERLDEAIRILEGLEESDVDEVEEAVHAVRKRCKEVRAAARLFRSTLGADFDRFNRSVRESAETLAPIRDAHAVLETFDELTAARKRRGDPDLARVRTGQADAAAEATRTIRRGDPRIEQAHGLLVAARKQVKRWKVGDGFVPIGSGIERSYRRGRRDLRRARARPTDVRMHEWRKSLKTLWYQLRLIEPAAPSVLAPLVATLDDVADALGDYHDLAVLIERLTAHPDRFGGEENVEQAIHLARHQQEDLRRRAFRLGATLYAEAPATFANRLKRYWDCTRRDGVELPTGGIAELAADEKQVAGGGDPAHATARTQERERKFLLEVLPELRDEGTTLRQGYLAIDGSVSVRVRDDGGAGYTLTVKAGRGAVRSELEFALDAEQFAAAWQHTRGRCIRKTRYRVPLGEHVVEVDVFHDDLDGIVVAEVEFDDDEALAAFEPPEWFGPEVTHAVDYSNAALAVNAARGRPSRPHAARRRRS